MGNESLVLTSMLAYFNFNASLF